MHKSYELIDYLKKQLLQPLPGPAAHVKMAGRKLTDQENLPKSLRDSAVMCLLFFRNEEWWIILIRRTVDTSAHSGQISFPGGKWEKFDKDFQATALRETQEEIGILPHQVTPLGALSPLYIPVSNFLVHPFIGLITEPEDYSVNELEVASIIEAPLAYILDEQRKTDKEMLLASQPQELLKVPIYQLDSDDFIWGATAMILAELEQLLSS